MVSPRVLTAGLIVLLLTGAVAVSTPIGGWTAQVPLTPETCRSIEGSLPLIDELKPEGRAAALSAPADLAPLSTPAPMLAAKPSVLATPSPAIAPATAGVAVGSAGGFDASKFGTRPYAAARDPASKELLPAPLHVHPNRQADLHSLGYLRLHWDKVDGARRYHVRAWQFSGNKQVVLMDESMPETETQLEPQFGGPVYWQVAAVDEAGNAGHAAGPMTVEILKKRR